MKRGRKERTGSSAEFFGLGAMVVVLIGLAVLLLSNHQGAKAIAEEVDRVERDLVGLAEEIHHLSGLERDRAFSDVEQERLARERLQWTAPGEYILRLVEPTE